MKINMYDIYYALYKQGRISKMAWEHFCTECLVELMETNKDVLLRLKN